MPTDEDHMVACLEGTTMPEETYDENFGLSLIEDRSKEGLTQIGPNSYVDLETGRKYVTYFPYDPLVHYCATYSYKKLQHIRRRHG